MRPLSGLYAITPDGMATKPLLDAARQALEGGARILQYRDKSKDQATRLKQAKLLSRLCQQAAIPFIINDDVDLALATLASGVHLGKDDGSLIRARERLGSEAIIGVSCYNDIRLARKAAQEGASYLAFGSFFPSDTKPLAQRAHPELLVQAKSEFSLPLVAIGGITPDNAQPLLEAGADMLAVINALFAQADIRAASARFASLFSRENK